MAGYHEALGVGQLARTFIAEQLTGPTQYSGGQFLRERLPRRFLHYKFQDEHGYGLLLPHDYAYVATESGHHVYYDDGGKLTIEGGLLRWKGSLKRMDIILDQHSQDVMNFAERVGVFWRSACRSYQLAIREEIP